MVVFQSGRLGRSISELWVICSIIEMTNLIHFVFIRQFSFFCSLSLLPLSVSSSLLYLLESKLFSHSSTFILEPNRRDLCVFRWVPRAGMVEADQGSGTGEGGRYGAHGEGGSKTQATEQQHCTDKHYLCASQSHWRGKFQRVSSNFRVLLWEMSGLD